MISLNDFRFLNILGISGVHRKFMEEIFFESFETVDFFFFFSLIVWILEHLQMALP